MHKHPRNLHACIYVGMHLDSSKQLLIISWGPIRAGTSYVSFLLQDCSAALDLPREAFTTWRNPGGIYLHIYSVLMYKYMDLYVCMQILVCMPVGWAFGAEDQASRLDPLYLDSRVFNSSHVHGFWP